MIGNLSTFRRRRGQVPQGSTCYMPERHCWTLCPLIISGFYWAEFFMFFDGLFPNCQGPVGTARFGIRGPRRRSRHRRHWAFAASITGFNSVACLLSGSRAPVAPSSHVDAGVSPTAEEWARGQSNWGTPSAFPRPSSIGRVYRGPPRRSSSPSRPRGLNSGGE